jgi:hypothetical protein
MCTTLEMNKSMWKGCKVQGCRTIALLSLTTCQLILDTNMSTVVGMMKYDERMQE